MIEQKKYKVKLNSMDKLEELVQENYDQICKHLKEIQNEISKLISATNLGDENLTMEDKAKYAKAIHDFMGDKKAALALRADIAKFMGEIIKYNGDANAVLNDKNFTKKTSLKLDDIRAAVNGDDDIDSYNLRKN